VNEMPSDLLPLCPRKGSATVTIFTLCGREVSNWILLRIGSGALKVHASPKSSLAGQTRRSTMCRRQYNCHRLRFSHASTGMAAGPSGRSRNDAARRGCPHCCARRIATADCHRIDLRHRRFHDGNHHDPCSTPFALFVFATCATILADPPTTARLMVISFIQNTRGQSVLNG